MARRIAVIPPSEWPATAAGALQSEPAQRRRSCGGIQEPIDDKTLGRAPVPPRRPAPWSGKRCARQWKLGVSDNEAPRREIVKQSRRRGSPQARTVREHGRIGYAPKGWRGKRSRSTAGDPPRDSESLSAADDGRRPAWGRGQGWVVSGRSMLCAVWPLRTVDHVGLVPVGASAPSSSARPASSSRPPPDQPLRSSNHAAPSSTLRRRERSPRSLEPQGAVVELRLEQIDQCHSWRSNA